MPNTHSPTLELDGLSIILLGSFNPAIFQPWWFARNDLIRDAEAESAEVEFIHPGVTIFRTEWFSLQVSEGQFAVDTADASKNLTLRDLVVSTFTVLEHTPITKLGLNSLRHYRMASDDEWHAVGDHYAPKDSWAGLFDHEPRIGMRSLTILGNRAESQASRISIKIEPSLKIRPGVYVHINQHYDLAADDVAGTNRQMVRILSETWNDFLAYRDRVSEHIFAEVKKGRTK